MAMLLGGPRFGASTVGPKVWVPCESPNTYQFPARPSFDMIVGLPSSILSIMSVARISISGTQRPDEQTLLSQSAPLLQMALIAHHLLSAVHRPPQSMSLSSWFVTSSLQVPGIQTVSSHTPLSQSSGSLQ